jgi:hypothetical protein
MYGRVKRVQWMRGMPFADRLFGSRVATRSEIEETSTRPLPSLASHGALQQGTRATIDARLPWPRHTCTLYPPRPQQAPPPPPPVAGRYVPFARLRPSSHPPKPPIRGFPASRYRPPREQSKSATAALRPGFSKPVGVYPSLSRAFTSAPASTRRRAALRRPHRAAS